MARPRGHVEQRGDGNYRIWIPLGTKPDGTPNYYREIFHGDKGAAVKRRDALLVLMDTGRLSSGGNIPYSAFLTRWLEEHVKLHREYTTHKEYERIVTKRIIPALGNIKVRDLTPLHIQNFYSSLQKDGARLDDKPGTLSAGSIRQIHAIIHGSLNHAVDPLRMIFYNPANNAKLPRIDRQARRRKRRLWSESQLYQFLNAIADHPHKALVFTLAYTGMRIGEVLALKWDAVDFDRRMIHIREGLKRAGKNAKFGPVKNHQERPIPMDDALYPVLRAHRTHIAECTLAMGGEWNPAELVFPSEAGTPIFNKNFRDRVWVPMLGGANKKAKADGKEDVLPYINLHGLRHTFATVLGTSGIDPAKLRDLLGHYSSSFSIDEYVTPNEDDLRDAVSVFSRRVNKTASNSKA